MTATRRRPPKRALALGLVVLGGAGGCTLLVPIDDDLTSGRPDAGIPEAQAAVDAGADAAEAHDAAAPDAPLEPLGCPESNGLREGAPWPTLAGCFSRAGRSALIGPKSPDRKHAFSLPIAKTTDTHSAAAVAEDGAIFAGTEDNGAGLHALAPDGAPDWVAAIDNSESSSLGADGYVYASAGHGVASLDEDSGEPRWVFDTGGEVDSNPTVGSDGTIFVGSHAGTMVAIHPDGTERWTLAVSGKPRAPALGPDETLYVTTRTDDGGFLYAFRPEGSIAWAQPVGGDPRSPSVDTRGRVYVGAQGAISAFASDGTLAWRFEIPYAVSTMVAIGRDRTVYAGTTDGRFVAVDEHGALVWSRSYPAAFYGVISIDAEGIIYAATDEPAVYAFGPAGDERWRAALPAPSARGTALGDGGSLIVLTKSGTVVVFDP